MAEKKGKTGKCGSGFNVVGGARNQTATAFCKTSKVGGGFKAKVSRA